MGGEKEIGTTKTDTSCLAGTSDAAKLLAAGGSAIVFPKAPQFNIECTTILSLTRGRHGSEVMYTTILYDIL